MAARQDQTLIIVNISCILLFLVSAVVAYVGIKGMGDAKQELASVNERLTGAQTQARNLQTENEELRVKMGFGATDNLADVRETFQQEMTKYAPGQNENPSYRAALQELYNLRQSAEASEAEAKAQVNDLIAQKDALVRKHELEMQGAAEARDKALADLDADRKSFAEYRKTLGQEQTNLRGMLDQQSTGFEARMSQLDAQVKQYQDQVAKLERTIAGLQDRLKPAAGSFEVADGNISWVHQGGMVWIDLGADDALRPLITFSVFDADENDAARSAQKGTIEVTRVLGPHQSEARVTSDNPLNPMINGDRIYSPAWNRGKQLHFALAGIIDADGDGRSDLQLVRELIELAGGVVDAYVSDDGDVEGTMRVNTRFLVLGDLPEGVLQTKHLDGWQQLNKEAVALGVETIPLGLFLDQVGYVPDSRTVRFGRGRSAGEVTAPPPGESPPLGTSNIPQQFRPRTRQTPPGPRAR